MQLCIIKSFQIDAFVLRNSHSSTLLEYLLSFWLKKHKIAFSTHSLGTRDFEIAWVLLWVGEIKWFYIWYAPSSQLSGTVWHRKAGTSKITVTMKSRITFLYRVPSGYFFFSKLIEVVRHYLYPPKRWRWCAFSILQKWPKMAKMTSNNILALKMALTEPQRNT